MERCWLPMRNRWTTDEGKTDDRKTEDRKTDDGRQEMGKRVMGNGMYLAVGPRGTKSV